MGNKEISIIIQDLLLKLYCQISPLILVKGLMQLLYQLCNLFIFIMSEILRSCYRTCEKVFWIAGRCCGKGA